MNNTPPSMDRETPVKTTVADGNERNNSFSAQNFFSAQEIIIK